MRIKISLIILLTLALFYTSEAKKRKPIRKQLSNPRIEIQQVLSAQQKSWNEGKIEGYMQGYWNNDSLTFVGKKGVTRGWKNTLANYKKSYPDKTAMGKLNLELISIKILPIQKHRHYSKKFVILN